MAEAELQAKKNENRGVRYFLILSSLNLSFSVIAVIWFKISEFFGLDPLHWKIQYWWLFFGVLGQIIAVVLWLTPWIEKKLYLKAENMIRKLKLNEEIHQLTEKKAELQKEIIEIQGGYVARSDGKENTKERKY